MIRAFSARRRPSRRSISSCQFRQSKVSGGIDVHELHREIRLRQRIRHERHARRAIEAGQPQLLDDGDVGLQQTIEPTGSQLDAAQAGIITIRSSHIDAVDFLVGGGDVGHEATSSATIVGYRSRNCSAAASRLTLTAA